MKQDKKYNAIRSLGGLEYLIAMYIDNPQIKFRMQRQLKLIEAYLMGRI